jgi:hypothetical protein
MKQEREERTAPAQKAKQPYVAPRLTVHGTVEQLTQSNTAMGTQLDMDFSRGTNWRDLTWS